METKTIFSKRITELRIKSGKSQESLAKDLGISTGAVCLYETGQRVPSITVLVSYAGYFNVSADFLIGKDPLTEKAKAIDEIAGKTVRLNDLLKETVLLIDSLAAGKNKF